jgi:hypothetical protein
MMVFFTGCSDDATSYTSCTTDAECKTGEACVGGKCQPAGGCSTDADCAMGEECAPEGYCREKEEVTCSVDTECQQDELCLDGTCQIPPSCTEDADCPTGTLCEDDRCARPCTTDQDCGGYGYVCQNGHCFQRCLSDANCQETNTICENNMCVPAECIEDADCTGQQVHCEDGRCAAYTTCTTDADCAPNYECLNNICEELPTCAIDADCAQDCQTAACICKDGHCHEAATCATEAECSAEEDCVGGICVPHLCRGPDDCQAGEICVAGACVQGGNPAQVYEVIILTPGGPIRSGQQIQLEALALKQNGDEVPGIGFDWNSAATNNVRVDAGGVASGESVAGDAAITATAQGTNPSVVSLPVIFTNVLDPTSNTVRVTVVNSFNRMPVAGAIVVLDDGTTRETGTTNASGSVELADPGNLADVHVFSDDHDYVSVLGTISKDLLVPLPDRSKLTKAGGFSGQMTFVGDGEVSIGLAGTSIAGQLIDMNFGRLLGQVFNVTISIGGSSTEMPLPAQMVANASVQGMSIPIKDTYYVVGQRGLRVAWAMGGFIDMSVLMGLLQGGNINDVLIELLPYFSLFKHGLMPIFDVFPQDLVVDANDLDGDQDTTEMRPDWGGALPDLDLEPSHSQDIYLNVTPPNTPTHGGQPITTVVYVSGAMSSLGFTPLGLTSDQAVNSVADPMTMKMAPAYGGLEVGEYAVMVMAVPPALNNQMPADVAMVLYVDKNLPASVSFDHGFLAFPEDAVFTTANRELTASAVAGATLYRSTIQTDEGRWIVYLSGSGMLAYTLPAVPGGMDNLGAGDAITLDPIALSEGLTFEDLVTFNGDDLDRINNLSTAFTHHQL